MAALFRGQENFEVIGGDDRLDEGSSYEDGEQIKWKDMQKENLPKRQAVGAEGEKNVKEGERFCLVKEVNLNNEIALHTYQSG